MDGYDTELGKKYLYMHSLINKQSELDKRMNGLLTIINDIPNIPNDLEVWVESITDIDGYHSFKLSDFSRMFKVNKEYHSIMEERDKTNRLIKIAVIDNIIESIKNILK